MKNNLLQLRGEFIQERRPSSFGRPKLKGSVSADHLINLKEDLESLKSFWNSDNIIDGALIDVKYSKIVPKSSRISSFFSDKKIDTLAKKRRVYI